MTLCGSEVPQDRWRGRTAGSGMWTRTRESAIMEPLRRLRHPLRLISAYSSPPKDQGVVGPPDETVRLSAGGAPEGAPWGPPGDPYFGTLAEGPKIGVPPLISR